MKEKREKRGKMSSYIASTCPFALAFQSKNTLFTQVCCWSTTKHTWKELPFTKMVLELCVQRDFCTLFKRWKLRSLDREEARLNFIDYLQLKAIVLHSMLFTPWSICFKQKMPFIAGSTVKLEPIISQHWLRTCRLHLISHRVETAEPSGLTQRNRHRSLGVTIVRSFRLIDAHAPG